MKSKLLLLTTLIAATFAANPASAQTNVATGEALGGGIIQYELNFGGSGNALALGNWSQIALTDSTGTLAPQLTATTNPEAISLGGDYTLNLVGTFGFWLGANDPANPVDKSAWYYTKADNGGDLTPVSPTFTISGLSAGDVVSLWGTFGWDTGGKAPVINFNGLGDVNLNTATALIGTDPGTASLVSIANGVTATGPSLTGLLNYPSSGNGEGQLGALIIQITPAAVPEPSTFALLPIGLALGVFVLRRRKTMLIA